MKRILITGAGGLLGLAILKKLPINNYNVFAATLGKSNLSAIKGVTEVKGDLLCQSFRRGLIESIQPDIIIHLAWNQTVGFRNSDINLEWLAVSLDLLQDFYKNGGKRFIFAGSSSEYDGSNGKFAENEGFAKTMYGICKRKFTETAEAFGENFGIQTVSARYFTIYGENDRHSFGAIPSAINGFLRGNEVICKAPDSGRDYIYAGDAAAATIQLLKSEITGPVNIATGSVRTMREVFTAIAAEMGTEQLLHFADPPEPADMLAADISRMKNELGYECQIKFDEGLKKTIDWWRQNHE